MVEKLVPYFIRGAEPGEQGSRRARPRAGVPPQGGPAQRGGWPPGHGRAAPIVSDDCYRESRRGAGGHARHREGAACRPTARALEAGGGPSWSLSTPIGATAPSSTGATAPSLSFSPDTKRPPTYFSGRAAPERGLPRGDLRPARRGGLRPALQAQGQDGLQGLGGQAGGRGRRRHLSPSARQVAAALQGPARGAGASWSRQQRSAHGAVPRGPAPLLQVPLRAEQGLLVRARPGHHRPPGRGLLRVLQPGRVELRPARRQLRGVRERRRVRLRHDQHRLLVAAVRRVPEDPQLQDDDASRSTPPGFEVEDGPRRRVQGGEDRPARTRGCAGSCRSARR